MQTWYYFRRRVKRFIHRGIIWPEKLTKSKTVLACGSSPEKAVPTWRKLLIEVFATSTCKQPTSYCKKRQLSLPATSSSFGSNREHVTRKYVQIRFKHECLAAKRLNFVRTLDKCWHTAHYKRIDRNRKPRIKTLWHPAQRLFNSLKHLT